MLYVMLYFVRVAVPGAEVTHLWWNAGWPCLGHIVGWTAGETLLPDLWPDKTYRAAPTGCEALLFDVPIAVVFASKWAALHAMSAVFGAELLLSTYAYYEHAASELAVPYRRARCAHHGLAANRALGAAAASRPPAQPVPQG